jgi:hypothetical protein
MSIVCELQLNRHTAGGGAYYFAKQEINKDRAAKHEAVMRRKAMNESLEYSSNASRNPSLSSSTPSPIAAGRNNGGALRDDNSGSPSQEATSDPAPTRHAPDSETQKVFEKSKYETSQPFVSRKGDRFS